MSPLSLLARFLTWSLRGIGERQKLALLHSRANDTLTIEQYLQPHNTNVPVVRHASPEEFLELESRAGSAGRSVMEAPKPML